MYTKTTESWYTSAWSCFCLSIKTRKQHRQEMGFGSRILSHSWVGKQRPRIPKYTNRTGPETSLRVIWLGRFNFRLSLVLSVPSDVGGAFLRLSLYLYFLIYIFKPACVYQCVYTPTHRNSNGKNVNQHSPSYRVLSVPRIRVIATKRRDESIDAIGETSRATAANVKHV